MNHDLELGDNLTALDMLADMGYIDKESAVYGIAQRYLHEGLDALTPKQRFVFDKHAAPVLFKSCLRCGEGIEISALPDAYEQDLMLCSYHMHKHHKEE